MRIIKEESLIRKADIAQSPFQRDSRKHMFPNPNIFSSNHHCIALIYVTLVVEDINSVLSTRAGFGADGRGRKRSRLRALVPSTGRQLRRLSQKIVFNSSRQRGKESLSPCHGPHPSTPTSATTSSLLTSKCSVRRRL